MEHLALEIFDLTGTGSKFATLGEDASITITDTSEIFASGDVWSHSFTLNVKANAHIFGTAGDIHGSRLHEQINKRRARLWVEGLPVYLGFLMLGDEAEVDEDGNVDVSFESGQKTFEDMIEGAKANQVPMMSDVEIGMALWRKRWVKYRLQLTASAIINRESHASLSGTGSVTKNDSDILEFTYDGEDDGNSVQDFPRMVFPKGVFTNRENEASEEENCINTDNPYTENENGVPTYPYCNIALCYQKSGYEKKDDKGNVYNDYSGEPELQRGYEYMPANRVNSAPCFFVIYWLRALMKHLGIYVEENQMMDVEDLRRLFFVNTNCAYEEPKYLRSGKSSEYRKRFGVYRSDADGAGKNGLVPEYINLDKSVDKEKSGFAGSNISSDGPEEIKNVSVSISAIKPETGDISEYLQQNNYYHKAFASSECFPDADISEVIKAIESGFGVRFLFSEDYKRVRIILLRNIFHGNDIQDIACDIISDMKTENSIRGFRMTYGDNKDNTEFYYKGFADLLPHKKPYFVDNSDKHDYSRWQLKDVEYVSLLNKISAFDKTCYVTDDTGNAYGIKIDKDAKRYDELHPSLFEFAGYMDAEDGDCTGEEDTIETVSVGFVPAIMNDVNFEQERNAVDEEEKKKQRFALFVDETMRPRRVPFDDGTDYNNPEAIYSTEKLYGEESPAAGMKGGDGLVKPGLFYITSDVYAEQKGVTSKVIFPLGGVIIHDAIVRTITFDFAGKINAGYMLYLQDNYEPNDDGICPIEKHDWGLTLGIMRGSGSDAYINYEADPQESEGNDTWDIVSGSSVSAHPDTCDNNGRLWNYDIEPGRTCNVDDLRAAGWDVSGESGTEASCTYHFLLHTETDGVIDFLCTPIKYIVGRDWNPVLTKDGLEAYVTQLWNTFGWDFPQWDTWRIILSAKTSDGQTAFADGRFSLKLRAEKLNPYYVAGSEDPREKDQYLDIKNPSLRGRGLCDQFYKEYSYWVRNARIAKMTVRMELAQLMAIDKTKKVTVGDVTGFIRKMQYSVNNQTGLGMVTMEVMYI